MTVQNPAVFLQSEAHPAEDVRRMFGAMAGASGGIVAASDLEVTETSGAPSMGVDVAGGQAWIAGSEATYQGVYFAENRGVETLTIGASDPTNGRYDLIVAKVEDSEYSGSVNAWSLVVVAGTADPSPSDPATPANSITLARVTVGAGVSTITDADITDLRTFADGTPAYAATGLAVYADAAARTAAVPSPTEGAISYLSDTDTVEVYDGSAWVSVGGATMIKKVDRFTASGTWTVPAGVTYAVAHIRGAGGGLEHGSSLATTGGSSSVAFPSGTITANGGLGICTGFSGGAIYTANGATNSGLGSRATALNGDKTTGISGTDGALIVAGDTVTPGASYAVTIGAPGTGAHGGSGYVWIEYFEEV